MTPSLMSRGSWCYLPSCAMCTGNTTANKTVFWVLWNIESSKKYIYLKMNRYDSYGRGSLANYDRFWCKWLQAWGTCTWMLLKYGVSSEDSYQTFVVKAFILIFMWSSDVAISSIPEASNAALYIDDLSYWFWPNVNSVFNPPNKCNQVTKGESIQLHW